MCASKEINRIRKKRPKTKLHQFFLGAVEREPVATIHTVSGYQLLAANVARIAWSKTFAFL